MMGLEPTTFCMARNWHDVTVTDCGRQTASLCGFLHSRQADSSSHQQTAKAD